MTPITVLIIEDEPTVVDYLSRALEKEDFGVLKSSDASTGLKTAEDHHPDLILLDILLPGEGGEVLLQALKASPKTKDIPVVILTNLTDEATQKKCKALGCTDYLIKADYRLDQLVEKIKTICRSGAT